MTWSLYRWIWQLESPLYIGMAPAGSINRCRLYIPARALWGALTAELARSQNAGFPDYAQVGRKLQEVTRLGYLFPAEQVNADWRAWLPVYNTKGLVWEREDGNSESELQEREFRVRLLGTRPGTAIDPESDTAEEGSLRETEVLNNFWRQPNGAPGLPVGLVGYVFVYDKGVGNRLIQIEILSLGGDTRYGLGKIRRLSCTRANQFFGYNVDLSGGFPVVTANRALAHVTVIDQTANDSYWGQQEILSGWDYGTLLSEPRLFWQPGYAARDGLQSQWRIVDQGYWVKH